MAAARESIAVRLLKLLSMAVLRRPGFFLWPQFVLLGLCVYYTVRHLEFNTSRNDLVGSDKVYHRNYLAFKKEFDSQDDLVAVVESEDTEKNRQFVERLGARLEREPKIFGEVFYRGDLKMLGPKALLFLDEKTLLELKKTMGDFRPFVDKFTKATNLNSLFQLVNGQFLSAKREENSDNESLIRAVPALKRIVDQGADSIKRTGTPPSPGVTALFDASSEAEAQQYITFAKGKIYLVNTRPAKEGVSEEAVERMRELVRQTQAEVPGVNVGITGEPVLEYDEMAQSQKDSTIATIVSLIVCALIFIYGYSETGRPLKATLCLVVGLGYTMGFTTLTVGHLNILTITFLPILIGLAIDFGVHLITRYEEELRHGHTREYALEKAMVNTGLGIFTGCFTTAGAFFAMALTDFKGIQEMGIITGGGMLICLVPMMTLLPVLLLKGKQNAIDEHTTPESDTRAKVERLWLDRPVPVALVTAGICAVCVLQFGKVFFDYNLLHMQSKGLPAVAYEHKLIDSASKSVLFGVVVATNAEQATALEAKLTNLVTVATNGVDTMSHYFVGDQTEKLRIIGGIKTDLGGIKFAPMDIDPVEIPKLSLTLYSLVGYLGNAILAVEEEKNEGLAKQLRELSNSIKDLRYQMLNNDPRLVSEKLAAFQQALFTDLQGTFQALRTQDNSSALKPEDLPPALRNRFIGKTGKQLLQVYPKGNVWEREEQEKFVKEIRTVDPMATGTPVQLYEYTTLLKDSYIMAAWYALGAIILLVFIHFRSVTCVVLALLPVAIGAIWMAGAMGLLGIPFNPANIMTLPLVIGIGVTNGIHILNRFAEEQNPGILGKSTGKAVIVSALTTIAGFGSLIPAKHQGIASLGAVMSVGVGTCMLAAITFLPALLHLMGRWGWSIKKPSVDNALSTLGREEPR